MNPDPRRNTSTLRNVPTAMWVGLAIAVAGFVVTVSTKEVTSDSSGYSCTYHNYAGFLVAAAVLVCIVRGWMSQRRIPDWAKLPPALMLGFTVVLLVLSVVHVLRGTGTIMNECDSNPGLDTP